MLADKVASAVGHFPLDEASGSRVSSVGSHTLTDNNTVGSGAGLVDGNSADFEASNSEYLSEADHVDYRPGDGKFCIRCVVRLESKSASMAVVAKADAATLGRNWILYYSTGNDRFNFFAEGPGGSVNLPADTLGSPSTGVDYLIHARFEPASDLLGIAINADTEDTTSNTSLAGGIINLAVPFTIGSYDSGNYMDGLVDDVVILKGDYLDADERTEDWNDGDIVPFAEWDAVASTPIAVSDSLDITLTESFGADADIAVTDALDITLTETSGVAVVLSLSDGLNVTLTETITSSFSLSISDSLDLTLTESLASNAFMSVTDTLSITLIEVYGGSLWLSVSDSLDITLTENFVALGPVLISVSDSLDISFVESFGIVDNPIIPWAGSNSVVGFTDPSVHGFSDISITGFSSPSTLGFFGE